jgi:IS605 OrfB family transposase
MKTFKIRIKPNKKQEKFFWEQCRLSRNLYNEFLSLFKLKPVGEFTYLETRQQQSGWSHFSLGKHNAHLRKRGNRYHELLSDAANVTMKELSVSIQEFFKRCKRGEKSDLKFRNYRDNNTFTITTISPKLISRLNEGYIGIAAPNVNGKREKYGHVKICDRGNFHQQIGDGKIKQIKISHEGNYWYACIIVDNFVETRKSSLGVIGIDLGVTNPVTTSKEEFKDMPRERMLYWQNRLNFYHKKLARQRGGKGVASSNRREKTKKHIQRCYRNIQNLRNQFQHEVSHELTRDNHIICIEDLNTKNMTKSAKGDAEKHGKNVKAKSGLNREILNVGFYGLTQKIQYKSTFRGGQCVMVDPKYTSQTCSKCGHVDSENRKTQDTFKCVKCGHTENADFNASKNILEKGLTQLQSNVV